MGGPSDRHHRDDERTRVDVAVLLTMGVCTLDRRPSLRECDNRRARRDNNDACDMSLHLGGHVQISRSMEHAHWSQRFVPWVLLTR